MGVIQTMIVKIVQDVTGEYVLPTFQKMQVKM